MIAMKVTAPLRASDKWGSGWYGAPRGGRAHNGVDVACFKGSIIHSNVSGKVTKIGYPYPPSDPKKGHYRYVEVEAADNWKHRTFYIDPLVQVGDYVTKGDKIGKSQGLTDLWPGMTDHVHYEIKVLKDGKWTYIDPTNHV